ncbi:hypothetical protein GCM10023186_21390 [Hymenobacter koreensis]|uniref:Uncharacterized protein n=2 Tax=Hymenobacter koreensis TaxID=1084523 RepID=A0ABP8IZ91_9BACT
MGKAGMVEEYNVLVGSKDVRQGAYVRYFGSGLGGVRVLESGNYENGLKEGEWQVFSEQPPWNKLVSKGTYRAGQADGWWTYYQLIAPRTAKPAVTIGKDTVQKTGYSVNITDDTAVPQAQGQCALGKRIGIWTYYDRQGQEVQKVNHFTNQLLYWRKNDTLAISSAAAATHPVLYAGGREQLKAEIYHRLGPEAWSAFISKKNVSVFVFAVAADGQLTGPLLADNPSPNRYEKVLLSAMSNVPAQWLPAAVNGENQAGEYRVRITTQREVMRTAQGFSEGVRTTVEPLGE